jgi:predicted GTPase
VVIINKIDSADMASIEQVRDNVRTINPHALVIEAASPVMAEGADVITGRRVLVVEDGPTATHGEMKFGAGTVVARKYGAGEIVDARPHAVGKLIDTYKTYPNIGLVLPAMGYGQEQVRDLEATIDRVPCDVVVIGTPIDLNRLVKIRKPTVRVRYDLQEIGRPDLRDALRPIIADAPARKASAVAMAK